MTIDGIKEVCAVMTKEEAIEFIDRIVNGLEKDCEAFGEAPEDTARLRDLYKLKKELL